MICGWSNHTGCQRDHLYRWWGTIESIKWWGWSWLWTISSHHVEGNPPYIPPSLQQAGQLLLTLEQQDCRLWWKAFITVSMANITQTIPSISDCHSLGDFCSWDTHRAKTTPSCESCSSTYQHYSRQVSNYWPYWDSDTSNSNREPLHQSAPLFDSCCHDNRITFDERVGYNCHSLIITLKHWLQTEPRLQTEFRLQTELGLQTELRLQTECRLRTGQWDNLNLLSHQCEAGFEPFSLITCSLLHCRIHTQPIVMVTSDTSNTI